MIVNVLSHTVLLPVLLAQAAYVRRHVLQLPEPPGARSGVIGDGPPLRLLIIGDSSAAGVGVQTQAEALLGRVTSRLSQVARVEFDLVARTGAKTAEALGWLDDLPRDAYDVVVTALGVNDVTKATPLRRWLSLQARLLDRLETEFGARRIIVSGLPPMGQFPLLPQPLRWAMGRRALWFDKHLHRLVTRRPACSPVTIRLGLNDTNMSADGFHPGPSVYAAWADEICAAVLADQALLDHVGATA